MGSMAIANPKRPEQETEQPCNSYTIVNVGMPDRCFVAALAIEDGQLLCKSHRQRRHRLVVQKQPWAYSPGVGLGFEFRPSG